MATADCLSIYKKIGHALGDIVAMWDARPEYIQGLHAFIEERNDPTWWVQKIGNYTWSSAVESLRLEYERSIGRPS